MSEHRLYGARTREALRHFPITDRKLHPALVRAVGVVKFAQAVAHRETDGNAHFSDEEFEAYVAGAVEIAQGKWDNQFPLGAYQPDFAAAICANAREVLLSRVGELTGSSASQPPWEAARDDNQTFALAVYVATALAIANNLRPTYAKCVQAMGRLDAAPVEEDWSALARAMGHLEAANDHAGRAFETVLRLPRTDDNSPDFTLSRVLAEQTGVPFAGSGDEPLTPLAACHGCLCETARWLASVAEDTLCTVGGESPTRPLLGSLLQAVWHVIGNDQSVRLAAASPQNGGSLPHLGHKLIESLMLLNNACMALAEQCERLKPHGNRTGTDRDAPQATKAQATKAANQSLGS